MKIKNFTSLAIALLLTAIIAFDGIGQSFYFQRVDRPHIISGGIGGSMLYGDMFRPSLDKPMQVGPSASISYLRRINERIYLRGEVNYYQLKGDDKLSYFEERKELDPESDRRGRNLSFRANNFEVSATAMIDLIPTYGYSYAVSRKNGRVKPTVNSFFRPNFTPYIFFGLGLTTNTPKAELDGTYYSLRPLQTEGVQYGPVTLTFPTGLGFRVKWNYKNDIGIEGGYRFTFTDYLDDVSDEYIDPSNFRGDPVALRLQDRRPEIGLMSKWQRAATSGVTLRRGDPTDNDGFFIVQVKWFHYLSKRDLQKFTQPRPRNTFR
ncbi:hypothetical protein [Peijinzhouia sedimentorum]